MTILVFWQRDSQNTRAFFSLLPLLSPRLPFLSLFSPLSPTLFHSLFSFSVNILFQSSDSFSFPPTHFLLSFSHFRPIPLFYHLFSLKHSFYPPLSSLPPALVFSSSFICSPSSPYFSPSPPLLTPFPYLFPFPLFPPPLLPSLSSHPHSAPLPFPLPHERDFWSMRLRLLRSDTAIPATIRQREVALRHGKDIRIIMYR